MASASSALLLVTRTVNRLVSGTFAAVIVPLMRLTPMACESLVYSRSDWIRYGKVLLSCSAVALL